jgi:hypothetical protein
MELNKEQIFEIAKDKIIELKIDRITNLFGHLPIDVRAFFKCFPVGSERYTVLINLTKQYERTDIES